MNVLLEFHPQNTVFVRVHPQVSRCQQKHPQVSKKGFYSPIYEIKPYLRVEFLLKTESGYLRDAEVT